MLTRISRRISSSALTTKLSPSSLHKLIRSSSSCSSPYSDTSPSTSTTPNTSLIYQHKLQFQRPPTIKRKQHLSNSVNLIGSILRPLKTVKSPVRFGVHTVLKLEPPPHSFEILLMMWDQMAEISSQHLKQGDLVYVSGSLNSYKKVDTSGELRLRYKVTVEELNYVTCNGRFQNSKKAEETDPIGVTIPTDPQELQKESDALSDPQELQKERDRLYLWQVFFANPHEWWDNRKEKITSRYPDSFKATRPDFKHKDTGERLWLRPEDPPWVRRQLERLDSRMAEQRYHGLGGSRLRVSTWTYED